MRLSHTTVENSVHEPKIRGRAPPASPAVPASDWPSGGGPSVPTGPRPTARQPWREGTTGTPSPGSVCHAAASSICPGARGQNRGPHLCLSGHRGGSQSLQQGQVTPGNAGVSARRECLPAMQLLGAQAGAPPPPCCPGCSGRGRMPATDRTADPPGAPRKSLRHTRALEGCGLSPPALGAGPEQGPCTAAHRAQPPGKGQGSAFEGRCLCLHGPRPPHRPAPCSPGVGESVKEVSPATWGRKAQLWRDRR